jgi:multicomponent K+:H+ antiporter subunit E
MSRLFPYPIISVGILGLWLLLNQTVSPGQLLLGLVIAVAAGPLLHTLEIPKARVRKLPTIARLFVTVVADVIRSNIAVAAIVLGRGAQTRRSGFVDIPLDIRSPHGLAVLACIITATPGTVWVNFDETSGMLTIHVLHLADEADVIAAIKQRYERPLLEIFA